MREVREIQELKSCILRCRRSDLDKLIRLTNLPRGGLKQDIQLRLVAYLNQNPSTEFINALTHVRNNMYNIQEFSKPRVQSTDSCHHNSLQPVLYLNSMSSVANIGSQTPSGLLTVTESNGTNSPRVGTSNVNAEILQNSCTLHGSLLGHMPPHEQQRRNERLTYNSQQIHEEPTQKLTQTQPMLERWVGGNKLDCINCLQPSTSGTHIAAAKHETSDTFTSRNDTYLSNRYLGANFPANSTSSGALSHKIGPLVTLANSNSTFRLPATLTGFDFKESPFFKHLDVLHPPQVMVPANLGFTTGRRSYDLSFALCFTPDQAETITYHCHRGSNDRMEFGVQVILRFAKIDQSICENLAHVYGLLPMQLKSGSSQQDSPSKSLLAEDSLPIHLMLQVNNRPIQLPPLLPSNRPGMDGRRNPRPINITHSLHVSPIVPNYIKVSWTHDYGTFVYNAFGIYLMHRRSPKQLCSLLQATSLRSAESMKMEVIEKLSSTNYHPSCDGADDDLIMLNTLPVLLLCPLSRCRIEIPVRGRHCKHVQCYDATTYLIINERKPTWKCPVCDNKVHYEDLFIDGLFLEVLNSSLTQNVEEVVFKGDGSWSIFDKDSPIDTLPKTPNNSNSCSSTCTDQILITHTPISSNTDTNASHNGHSSNTLSPTDSGVSSTNQLSISPNQHTSVLSSGSSGSSASGANATNYPLVKERNPYIPQSLSHTVEKDTEYDVTIDLTLSDDEDCVSQSLNHRVNSAPKSYNNNNNNNHSSSTKNHFIPTPSITVLNNQMLCKTRAINNDTAITTTSIVTNYTKTNTANRFNNSSSVTNNNLACTVISSKLSSSDLHREQLHVDQSPLYRVKQSDQNDYLRPSAHVQRPVITTQSVYQHAVSKNAITTSALPTYSMPIINASPSSSSSSSLIPSRRQSFQHFNQSHNPQTGICLQTQSSLKTSTCDSQFLPNTMCNTAPSSNITSTVNIGNNTHSSSDGSTIHEHLHQSSKRNSQFLSLPANTTYSNKRTKPDMDSTVNQHQAISNPYYSDKSQSFEANHVSSLGLAVPQFPSPPPTDQQPNKKSNSSVGAYYFNSRNNNSYINSQVNNRSTNYRLPCDYVDSNSKINVNNNTSYNSKNTATTSTTITTTTTTTTTTISNSSDSGGIVNTNRTQNNRMFLTPLPMQTCFPTHHSNVVYSTSLQSNSRPQMNNLMHTNQSNNPGIRSSSCNVRVPCHQHYPRHQHPYQPQHCHQQPLPPAYSVHRQSSIPSHQMGHFHHPNSRSDSRMPYDPSQLTGNLSTHLPGPGTLYGPYTDQHKSYYYS